MNTLPPAGLSRKNLSTMDWDRMMVGASRSHFTFSNGAPFMRAGGRASSSAPRAPQSQERCHRRGAGHQQMQQRPSSAARVFGDYIEPERRGRRAAGSAYYHSPADRLPGRHPALVTCGVLCSRARRKLNFCACLFGAPTSLCDGIDSAKHLVLRIWLRCLPHHPLPSPNLNAGKLVGFSPRSIPKVPQRSSRASSRLLTSSPCPVPTPLL